MSVRPRRRLFCCLLTVVLAATSLVAAPGSDRYMIEFHEFAGAAAAVRGAGGEVVHEFPAMRVVAARLPEGAARALQNNPRVKLMAPETPRVPMALWNDTVVNGETVPYGVQMVEANQVKLGGAMPKTCIIDSGYRITHEDLPKSPNVNGYNGTLPWNEDGDGHGTHVAGTIAALANGKGVVGVVGSDANLFIVRVFGNDGKWAYESDLIDALQQCRDAGAKVVSMSLGGGKPIGPWEQSAFDSAYNAGVLSIAAAGNAGDTSTSYPAGYGSVVSVAAVDADEVVADFSQKNSDVEIAGPGVNVYSTYPKLEVNTFTAWDNTVYAGNHIEASGRSASGVSGAVVDGGICDVAGAWSGKVVLCQRGTVSFKQKVDSVIAGGGVAAVLYNNVSGNFLGTCDDGTGTTCGGVPAISLSMEDGSGVKEKYLAMTATVVSRVEPADNQYYYNSGTSMATPHVSAVAALVWSHNSGWSNAQIRDALARTARDKGAAGRDVEYGYGIVQACGALKFLSPGVSCSGGSSEPPPPSDTTAPVISEVAAAKTHKNGRFQITWKTDESSNSEVRFTAGASGTYTDSNMVTSHSMAFSGKSGVLYEYYVSSTDAAGNKATSGPYKHQN